MARHRRPTPAPAAAAPPGWIAPMLAVRGELPRPAEGWAYEVKWDGNRCLAVVHDGEARLLTRNGNDATARYPELAGLGRALGGRSAVLDGEVVALDEHGVPSFQRLQRRLHVDGTGRTVLAPVHLALFDVLWLDGRSTLDLAWTDRRELLESLGLADAAWRTPPCALDDPGPLVQLCRERGLEGLVAKRRSSRYLPGRRSPDWLKVPLDQRDDLVVGGFMPGQRGRAGRIGSLLVGRYDGPVLRYAGRVGTGFDADDLEHLAALLDPLRRDASPFGAGAVPRGAVWVEPEVVVAVRFRTWTDAGILRHAAFLGVRDDVEPR